MIMSLNSLFLNLFLQTIVINRHKKIQYLPEFPEFKNYKLSQNENFLVMLNIFNNKKLKDVTKLYC